MVRIINEMSMSRTDAMERCISLGTKFIEHFHKAYIGYPNDVNVNHWLNEMDTWYSSVRKITLSQNNRPIVFGKLWEWFFSAGQNVDEIVPMNYIEQEAYNDFVFSLKDKGVKESFYNVMERIYEG